MKESYFIEGMYPDGEGISFLVKHGTTREFIRYQAAYDEDGGKYLHADMDHPDEFQPLLSLEGLDLSGSEQDVYEKLKEAEDNKVAEMLLLLGWLYANYGCLIRTNISSAFLGRSMDEFDFEEFRRHRYGTMQFGRWQGEPITWRLLHREPDAVLLITDEIIELKNFDEESNDYTKSEIRSWLNNDFLNTAFSKEERKNILLTELDNSKRMACISAEIERDRIDRISLDVENCEDHCFLLSTICADKGLLEWRTEVPFFMDMPRLMVGNEDESGTESRLCYDSARVKEELLDECIIDELDYEQDITGPWLLRSPGQHLGSVRAVDSNGGFTEIYPDSENMGIRVACRVKAPHIDGVDAEYSY